MLRATRQRVSGRLRMLLRSIRGGAAAEVEAAVIEAASLADEDAVVAAWREVLQDEVLVASVGAWHDACIVLSRDVRQERALCLELAVVGYEAALQVYTREAYPEQWAGTQMNLGNAYSDRIRGERAANLEAAIERYEAALQVRTREAYPSDHVGASSVYATALSDAGRDSDALSTCVGALEVLDELRNTVRGGTDDMVAKRQLTLKGQHLVATLVRCCLSLAQPRVTLSVSVAGSGGVRCGVATLSPQRDQLLLALQQVEKSRARSLAEAATQPQRPERLALERAEVAGLAEPEQRRRRQEAASAAAQPADAVPPTPTHQPSIAESPLQWYTRATALVGRNRAAVAWYLAGGVGCAFVLAETLPLPRVVEYREEEVGEINEAVAAFRASVDTPARPDPAAFDQHLSRLATALKADEVVRAVRETGAKGTAEAQHHGPSIASVLLLPYGPLHGVPLHALPCADGTRLAEHFTAGASRTPSLRLLEHAQQAAAALPSSLPSRLIIVQNPRQDLDGADQEAAHLSKLPNCVASVLAHDQATGERLAGEIASAVCSGDGAFGLHVAAHGKFAEGSRLDSSVELAGGDRLSVFDVLSRRFSFEKCALCVLSACESGLSDTTAEECIGLPAALLSSGVPRVVSTLWRVSDVASALLISEMYTRLDQHKGAGALSVGAALRNAQEWLRNLAWAEAETTLGLRFGGEGRARLLRSLRSLRGGGSEPVACELLCAPGVDGSLAQRLCSLSRSMAANDTVPDVLRGGEFALKDWGDSSNPAADEMSVMRAFAEGRLEWICTHAFFMDGGMPMRDYWACIRPPAGSTEAERYVVLHLHYLGTPDAPRHDELAQVNVRFGRTTQNFFYEPQVQMGMDAGGRSWVVTGHKEKKGADRELDTRWMGPGLTAGVELKEKGWAAGTRTRDLPPWRWRSDRNRDMAGQQAEGDGQRVHYTAEEKRRFAECHDLLVAAEAALQRGFSLAFDPSSKGIKRDLAFDDGASSGDASGETRSAGRAAERPFASPMFWAPFDVFGAA